jgi:hypothetical protein
MALVWPCTHYCPWKPSRLTHAGVEVVPKVSQRQRAELHNPPRLHHRLSAVAALHGCAAVPETFSLYTFGLYTALAIEAAAARAAESIVPNTSIAL